MSALETTQLTEDQVISAFHVFLKNALAQARAEKLLDDEILSSAEADLMICGPALCLFFAALRSRTNPPSVPLPRSTLPSSPTSALPAPTHLSLQTCPPIFTPLLSHWSTTVPIIQSLPSSQQHDLARIICDHTPLSSTLNPSVPRIANELRGLGIEISQRRSFQERYKEDLQAAMDMGVTARRSPSPMKATFEPPPGYDEEKPRLAVPEPSSPTRSSRNQSPAGNTLEVPRSPISESSRSRSPSPTLLSPTSPSITLIRETLYSTLLEVLSTTPSLLPVLSSDPSRGYFSAVALAVLHVSLNSMTPQGSVIGPLGYEITVEECPDELKGFMKELVKIGKRAKEIEAEDNEKIMKLVERGGGEDGDQLPEPRMDRVRKMLERGVGWEERDGGSGRVSPEGTVLKFVNQINALALGMTRLKAFRERQSEVFKVLIGAR